MSGIIEKVENWYHHAGAAMSDKENAIIQHVHTEFEALEAKWEARFKALEGMAHQHVINEKGIPLQVIPVSEMVGTHTITETTQPIADSVAGGIA